MFGSCVSTMVMPAIQKMSLANVKRFGESNCSFDLSLFRFGFPMLLSYRNFDSGETCRPIFSS